MKCVRLVCVVLQPVRMLFLCHDQASDPNRRDNSSSLAFFFFFFGFSCSFRDLGIFFGLLDGVLVLVDLDMGLLGGCRDALDIDTPRSVSAVAAAVDCGSAVEARSSLVGKSFDIEE